MSQDSTGSQQGAVDGFPEFPDAVFAWRLRAFRRAAGLTQQELAERTGEPGRAMHRSAIAKIEASARTVSIGEAVRLADALGVPLADLAEPRSGPQQRIHSDLVAARAKVSALAHEVLARGQALHEAEMLLDDVNTRLAEAQARVAELETAMARAGSEDGQ